MSPRAVHFGAGAIGRGFIAPLLHNGGYHVTFADIDKSIIDAINREHSYEVHILDATKRTMSVDDVSAQMVTSPDLVKEFVDADLITTSVGAHILPRVAPTIANGIKKKMAENPDGMLDLIACENGVGSSEILHEEVLKHLDENEKKWLEEHCGFANCSVDRIVPPFDNPEKDNPHHVLDVGVEEFYEWVVDQDSLKTEHGVKGMKLAKDLAGYVERKLFTLNTAHAIIGYLGYLKGYSMINEAIADRQIYQITMGAIEESGRALLKKHPHFKQHEHENYIKTIINRRLKNPNIHDEITRVGRNPKRKLGHNDRLIGPCLMAQEFGIKRNGFLEKGIAAALWFDCQDDEDAVAIRKSIEEKGVEATLREVAKLKDSGPENDLVQAVAKEYDSIKAELGKKRSTSPSKI